MLIETNLSKLVTLGYNSNYLISYLDGYYQVIRRTFISDDRVTCPDMLHCSMFLGSSQEQQMLIDFFFFFARLKRQLTLLSSVTILEIFEKSKRIKA